MTKLKCNGDACLAGFYHLRRLYSSSVKKNERIPDESLEPLLYEHLQHSKVLKEDVAHYHRQDKGTSDRNLAHLERCMARQIERERLKEQRAEQLKMINQVATASPAPSPTGGDGADPKPKAKAKGKGKAKGKAQPDKGQEETVKDDRGNDISIEEVCYWRNCREGVHQGERVQLQARHDQ